MIRLVVTDLDGTLLDDGWDTAKAIQISKWLDRRNIMFTIATGRSEILVKKLVKELDIHLPYIVCNGATIIQQNKVLMRKTVCVKHLSKIINYADANNLSIIYSIQGVERMWRPTPWIQKEYANFNLHLEEHRFEDNEWNNTQIDKLTLLEDSYTGHIAHIEAMCKDLPTEYGFTRYLDRSVEIVNASATKATALQIISDITNINMEEILAIGDHQNDIEMIAEVGTGVAVANATDQLKQVADYVAEQKGADGVFEAIKNFCNNYS